MLLLLEEEHTPLVAAYDIDDNFTKEDTAVTFDLPELGDEVPIDEAAVDGPAETANNVIVAFLQMFLAFLLLNFNEEGQPIMAIKSVYDKDEEEKTEIKPVSQEEELLMSKISENKFQVEDVPQIAAAEWTKKSNHWEIEGNCKLRALGERQWVSVHAYIFFAVQYETVLTDWLRHMRTSH